MARKAFKLQVFGKVQGVFYRKYTLAKAQELDIRGFVQNLMDGSVYIEAEAEEDKMQQFIAWCKIGSPRAEVIGVSETEVELKNFQDFTIKEHSQ